MEELEIKRTETHKWCPSCKRMLSIYKFYHEAIYDKPGLRGCSTYCKECTCNKKKEHRDLLKESHTLKEELDKKHINNLVEEEFNEIKNTITPVQGFSREKESKVSCDTPLVVQDTLHYYDTHKDIVKVCPKCGRTLTLGDFSKNRYTISSSYCKQCMKEIQIKRKLERKIRFELALKGETHL